MKQPDLGLKVNELRQQKGFTQEQLAEKCEVSARTVQRIESGEVDPRLYTLQCLSQALDFDFGQENTQNEPLWLAVLHLSSSIPLVVIPLLLWSWKKNQSYKIDQQGRLVLNFQITMVLLMLLSGFLLMLLPAVFTLVGESQGGVGMMKLGILELMILCAPAPMILIGIFSTYQGVVNAMRALSEKPIHYLAEHPFREVGWYTLRSGLACRQAGGPSYAGFYGLGDWTISHIPILAGIGYNTLMKTIQINPFNKQRILLFSVLFLALALAACGGRGDLAGGRARHRGRRRLYGCQRVRVRAHAGE